MLAQMKKAIPDDFAGRFGAWWNGRDYVAPAPAEAEAGAEAPAPAADVQPEPEPLILSNEAPDAELFEDIPPVAEAKANGLDMRLSSSGTSARLEALETLWGEGRFAPGSAELDQRLLEVLFGGEQGVGDIGFIGVDGVLLQAFASGSDKTARVAEWRAACLDRLRALAPKAAIAASEVDRPRGFEDGALDALISIEAFAFADHKAGLVARAYRALSDKGRWVFLDTTRTTNKAPAEAFASAWAEPQISTADEIEDLLKLAGFKSVKRENANDRVLAAARAGYAQLVSILETAAAGGLSGRAGAVFLQELAWEAQSWRARCRALEGGALSVDIWIADKWAPEAPDQDELTLAISDSIDAAPPSIENVEIDN
jgi:hypothetical protein